MIAAKLRLDEEVPKLGSGVAHVVESLAKVPCTPPSFPLEACGNDGIYEFCKKLGSIPIILRLKIN